MTKAAQFGADAVVFDLEDSVSPADKPRARDIVGRSVSEFADNAACEIHVRVNRLQSGGYDPADVDRVVADGVGGAAASQVRVGGEVAAVADMLDELETARGRWPPPPCASTPRSNRQQA
jgi:citrate lyase subunit beta / citryl-CoA lyase